MINIKDLYIIVVMRLAIDNHYRKFKALPKLYLKVSMVLSIVIFHSDFGILQTHIKSFRILFPIDQTYIILVI